MARAKRVSVKGMGADLFFGAAPPPPTDTLDIDAIPNLPLIDEMPISHADIDMADTIDRQPPLPPQHSERLTSQSSRSTTSPAANASTLASVVDSVSASLDPTIIDQIRKIVKVPGKEVSYVRLTPAEKGDLADIVYTYKRQGCKTTENEINRIAVNFMLLDYQEHGEESLLAKVLAALQA